MGTDSVIFIRTDGNSIIATGHLVRCLCIAQALEKEGKKITFLLSDEESFTLLKSLSSSLFSDTVFSFDTKILPNAKYNNLESELPYLTDFLANYKKPLLFIDSYSVTPLYFTALKPYASLAYMDDLRAFDYDVDLVINYDVIPPFKQAEYDNAYTKVPRRLLGAQYTPLRPQFQNQTYIINEKVQNILITTGGSDPYNFCKTFASSFLSEKQEIALHIIIGKLFTDNTMISLEQLAGMSPNVKLHYNVTDMATLMKQCDLAVSAAGTTLYELCAIGVPAVSFTFADNQITMANTFAETGAVPYAGDLRTSHSQQEVPSENTLHNINHAIKKLISDFTTRSELHSKTKALVPGNGTSEIAKALCRLA